jgi:soluble lytic murein transglycosylase-like protein
MSIRWWIFILVLAMILVTRKTIGGEGSQTRDFTGYDALFRDMATDEGIDWLLLKALSYQESRFNARAYNPEGYRPPEGKPAFSGEIPAGADITGYQGSFGLMQIYHADRWSTAKAYRPGGDYPEDLLDPGINVMIGARFLGDLTRKGFTMETIDVYNVGETAYAKGARNPSYRAAVKDHYQYFVNLVTT